MQSQGAPVRIKPHARVVPHALGRSCLGPRSRLVRSHRRLQLPLWLLSALVLLGDIKAAAVSSSLYTLTHERLLVHLDHLDELGVREEAMVRV